MPLPLLVPAIISAAGALGAAGVSAAANSKSARDQRNYNVEQWERQAEYNSPENQVKRLRQAGINPALAMSNGMMSVGNQTQAAESYSRPEYDFSPVAQGVNESWSLYNQTKKTNSEVKLIEKQIQSQDLRNRTQLLHDWTEISKMANDSSLSASQRDYYQKMEELVGKQVGAYDVRNTKEMARLDAETRKLDAEERYQSLMSDYQELVNSFKPAEQSAILRNLGAQYSQIMAAAYASNEHAAYSHALSALTAAQEQGVKIDNEYKPKLAKSAVDKAFAEAFLTQDENERRWLSSYYEQQGKAGQWLPQPAAMYNAASGFDKARRRNRLRP